MNDQQLRIQKLFDEKRYSELIFLIESEIENKSSAILNILAASRLLRYETKETFESAISEFREAYLKEKKTQHGFNAVKNFITTISNFFEYLHEDFKEDYFSECIAMFKEAEINFGYNKDLIKAIKNVFFRINNVDKLIYYLNKLNENKDLDLTSLSQLIYYNNYRNNWTQKDYLNNSKLIEAYCPKYPEEKLLKVKHKNNNKIHLGILTADIIRKHSITYFLKTILTNYDKEKFQISLYLNNKKDDEDTSFFKTMVSKSLNIFTKKDEEAINIIRDDGPGIIIDLMGLSGDNRITLFKNRLAPIQISWLGYCNTTGLNQMDYIIADPNLIYDEEKNFYSEKIIFLPHIWNCHSGFDLDRIESQVPYLSNKYITFGSFNNFSKITDQTILVWSDILKNVSSSKLILKSSTKVQSTRLKQMFKKSGVEESVFFAEIKKDFKDHLNLYNQIDIALDTFPYNGVTTSFESIWMGVPVLTMKGFNFNSRCGESINKNLGTNELIAENEKEYVFKAIELASNKEKLLNLRKFIFNNALTSNLFNQNKFRNDFFNSLEKIYRETL